MGGVFAAGGKPPLTDSDLVTLALEKGLKVYAGFKADEHRLVFVHGDNFKSSPTLVTILPSGVIEGGAGGKRLPPAKERAIVTYPYAQTLDAEKAAPHLSTHCVWQEDGDTFALVQLWTINYNGEFRKVFKESEENPNPDKFKQEAVDNLYTAAVGFWGEEAREQKVKYCIKTTQNIDRTYVGTGDQFQELFNAEGVKESLGIASVTAEEIVVWTVDKKGNKGSQTFPYGRQPGVQQVLYKRNGFTSFMCFKPLSQFTEECILHGEINP